MTNNLIVYEQKKNALKDLLSKALQDKKLIMRKRPGHYVFTEKGNSKRYIPEAYQLCLRYNGVLIKITEIDIDGDYDE